MESVIYYFSATGNSLRIANIMAERMDGLLLPMSKYKGTKCSSRQIGLVFPTYFWGVPRTVAEFVDEMKVEADNPYVFAAATCGGLAGGVLGHLDALLKKKGLHLDYGITIPSVANFIEEYNPKTRSADRKLREADEMAERASAEVIAARRNGPFGFHVWDRMFYKLYTDYKLNRDTGFHVDDTCVRCGICQRICPSRNIVLKMKTGISAPLRTLRRVYQLLPPTGHPVETCNTEEGPLPESGCICSRYHRRYGKCPG